MVANAALGIAKLMADGSGGYPGDSTSPQCDVLDQLLFRISLMLLGS